MWPRATAPEGGRIGCVTASGVVYIGVAIQDGQGKEIFGYDLAACCRGEKKLTPDLQAV
jgi:hypothetical protein